MKFTCADCVVSKADTDKQPSLDDDMAASGGLQRHVATGEGLVWTKVASLTFVVPCFMLEEKCSPV